MGDINTADKRFKLLDATMRRHGYVGNALIESLHTAQQAYGYLDLDVLRAVARALKLPPSRVYGVATFYNLFSLKPQGEHTCVVCTGTACYIKGAPIILEKLERDFHLRPGVTTRDNKASLLQARCFGSCALAPAVAFDGVVIGHNSPESVTTRVQDWLQIKAEDAKEAT
jgi:bidirectional [NiFe] hydrogenase diaphorase subunit